MRGANPWKAVAFMIALAAGGSSQRSELTAVFTQVQGNVMVAEATSPIRGQSEVPPRHAQFLQVVKSGDRLTLSSGSGAVLLCSSDLRVELTGGNELRLTDELCRKGKRLTPGTYLRLAPAAGRMRSLAGALDLEGESRGGDEEDFAVPIVLSPRNTKIRDARPTLLWTQVSEATEYEIELNGPKTFRLSLDASEVVCTETWGDSKVCSLPYPTQAPDLPPGTLSFLSVRTRRGLASPLREEAKPSRIERLSPDKAEDIRIKLEQLEDLPLDEAARQLLEADLYARQGLYAEAIPAYRKVLVVRDIPEVRVTLGDVLLEVGLLRMAARTYQEALDGNPGTAVQAAAEFGLGRVEYTRMSFEHAECHFRKARELYASLGLKEEAAAAKRGAGAANAKRQR